MPDGAGCADGVVRVDGFPPLSAGKLWNPSVVRWATIDPSGTVDVHASENVVAWEACEEKWLQWKLILDICAVLDPTASCVDHRMEVYEITDDADGMFLEPCLRHESGRGFPDNPAATALIAGLAASGPRHRPVRGTVVWLGHADLDGVHASITDERVAELRDIGLRHMSSATG